MKLDRGFYTALGTPLDADGRVLARSLCDEIERMTAAGTSGLLLLGSMGMQPAVAPDECAAAAKIAACQNAGRTPLFVGVMDNSIRAVCARIDALRGLPVDGVVLTPPYYYGVAPEALRNFYHSVADFSPFPVFLYDLPVATKIKLTYPMVAQLQKHPNIRGIKTADLPMILELQTDAAVKKDFTAFYSGLDTVHVGVQNGVCRYLDGMFFLRAAHRAGNGRLVCARKAARGPCRASRHSIAAGHNGLLRHLFGLYGGHESVGHSWTLCPGL